MSAKKTIKIETLKDTINNMLMTSSCDAKNREGVISVLEVTLQDSGNYQGFRYIRDNEMSAELKFSGHEPGIRTNENGLSLPAKEAFVNTDHTRVQYY